MILNVYNKYVKLSKDVSNYIQLIVVLLVIDINVMINLVFPIHSFALQRKHVEKPLKFFVQITLVLTQSLAAELQLNVQLPK